MIRVGVNGFGVIGRRVADAVMLQPDMELKGVVKVNPDYKARLAIARRIDIFAADEKSDGAFRKAGLQVQGRLDDLLKEVDVIVDACPEDIGAKNKPLYLSSGARAVFEGGEEPDVGELSFVAQCNFEAAKGKRFLRVVSCNTTGLCRLLGTLDSNFGVERARVVIARRAADPEESSKGPIDAITLDPVSIPSHHGEDVRSVLPHIRITSMAMKVPTTHMHLHALSVTPKDKSVTPDMVIDALSRAERTLLVSGSDGFKSTSQVMDCARELKRGRSDLYEVVVWQDSLKVIDEELYLYMAIHQEAIVIPENIDAIRALTGRYSAKESMDTTNRTLGVISSLTKK